MSAVTPLRALPPRSRPRPQASPQPASRPALRLVARPATAGRLPFVIAVAAVLATGLVSLLLLHTLAAQDAFTVHGLQRTAATLADREEELALANQQAQAPSMLAQRADALGMVPATTVTVGRLHGRPVIVLHAPVQAVSVPATAVKPAVKRPVTVKAAVKAPAKAAATPVTKPSRRPVPPRHH